MKKLAQDTKALLEEIQDLRLSLFKTSVLTEKKLPAPARRTTNHPVQNTKNKSD